MRAKSLLIMRYSIPSSRIAARAPSFRKVPIRRCVVIRILSTIGPETQWPGARRRAAGRTADRPAAVRAETVVRRIRGSAREAQEETLRRRRSPGWSASGHKEQDEDQPDRE